MQVRVTISHHPIVVDHAARHDEPVVRADEGDHFSAGRLECVKVIESVSKVGDRVRPGLRDRRVGCHCTGSRYPRSQRNVSPVAGVRGREHSGVVVSWICQIPSKLHRASPNGTFPSQKLKSVPRSIGNQILSPESLRGPSHMALTASASFGVRQFAIGVEPQILAFALNVQVRGSSMMPSATPSFLSHAAIAAFCTAASFGAAMTSWAISYIAIWPHIWAVWKRVQYIAGALAGMPSNSPASV